MTTGLIEQEWRSFESAALHPKSSENQRREMRRAFYAGAWALMQRTTKELSDGDEMTDADEALMRGVAEEFDQFLKDVSEGRG